MVIKSVCNLEGPASGIFASFKSKTSRELKQAAGKDVPGPGAHNTNEHLSIGVQKIQGGAPNNFLILTGNKDPSIHKVEVSPKPRIEVVQQRSKFDDFLHLQRLQISDQVSTTKTSRF